VLNARTNKIFLSVAITVTVYAVIQTSAGQTFSLLARDAQAGKTDVNISLITEYKKNLERIDTEYATINKQMQSIKTTEDRANYGVTVGRMSGRLQTLNAERTKTIIELKALSEKQSTTEIKEVNNMSVYDFYASMPAWSGMDWLKFLFHTVLSIFIALMTPIGLLSWTPSDAPVKYKKVKISKSDIERFVTKCWYGVRDGTREKILSEHAFNEWLHRDGIAETPGVYSALVQRCYAMGIIGKDGMAIIKNEEIIVNKLLEGAGK